MSGLPRYQREAYPSGHKIGVGVVKSNSNNASHNARRTLSRALGVGFIEGPRQSSRPTHTMEIGVEAKFS